MAPSQPRLPKRRYGPGVDLSIVGFGGMLAVGMSQDALERLVGESLDWGINYFDVAPAYGEGEGEMKLGNALRGCRDGVFLACKTLERRADAARAELERSLGRLRTGYLDLYQLHAIGSVEEAERTCAPGGALEALAEARELGLVRHLGFSAHSVPAALQLLERFRFDSVLLPVNVSCWGRGRFGSQVVEAARSRGVSVIALKALADGRWHSGEERRYPKCWYRPIDDPDGARDALRFALSQDVVAAIPPGEEPLFRMAVRLAADFTPLDDAECRALLAGSRRAAPLFRNMECGA